MVAARPVCRARKLALAFALASAAPLSALSQTLPPSGPVWTDWANIAGFYKTGQEVCDARATAIWGSNYLGVTFVHVPPDVPRCNVQGGTIAYPYLGYYCPIGNAVTSNPYDIYWFTNGSIPAVVYRTISYCTLPVQTADKLSCHASSSAADQQCSGRGGTLIGNAIDLAVGAKIHREKNLPRNPDSGWGLTLSYVGSRVSTAFKVATGHASPSAPLIGRGWTGSFFQRLVELGAGTEIAAFVVRPNGDVYFFNATGATYSTTPDILDRLEPRLAGDGQKSGWIYRVASDGSEEHFDLLGRLEEVIHRNGLRIRASYNGASLHPIALTDSYGKRLELEYRSNGTLSSVRDRAGKATTFEQDSYGRLVTIGFPDQTTRSFNYSNDWNYDYWQQLLLTAVVDESGGQYSSFEYTGSGAVSTSLAGGAGRYLIDRHSTPTSTDPTGTTKVTDPSGVSRTFRYQIINGAPFVTDISIGAGEMPCPHCGPKKRSYDANGNVAFITDWNDSVAQYRYDLARNLETGRSEGLKNVTGNVVATADTRTTTTSWHATYRLPIEVKEYSGATDASGNPNGTLIKTTRHTYDANGNQLQKDEIVGAVTRTWRWMYTTYGRVLVATDPNGKTTTTSYYPDDDPDMGRRGNVATVTNAAGHVTRYTAYNLHGQVTQLVDPNGLVTDLTYDPRLRLTSRKVGNELTSFVYDPRGLLSQVTLPDGAGFSYSYDAAHRLTGIQDHKGNRVVYTLDAMGNRINEQVTDPGSALVRNIQRTIDALNRVQQVVGSLQ